MANKPLIAGVSEECSVYELKISLFRAVRRVALNVVEHKEKLSVEAVSRSKCAAGFCQSSSKHHS